MNGDRRQARRKGVALVEISDRRGARTSAAHLLAPGHRHIDVVAIPFSKDNDEGPADMERQETATFPISRARLDGFAAAVRAAGLRWVDVPVYETRLNTICSGETAAGRLLARAPRGGARPRRPARSLAHRIRRHFGRRHSATNRH